MKTEKKELNKILSDQKIVKKTIFIRPFRKPHVSNSISKLENIKDEVRKCRNESNKYFKKANEKENKAEEYFNKTKKCIDKAKEHKNKAEVFIDKVDKATNIIDIIDEKVILNKAINTNDIVDKVTPDTKVNNNIIDAEAIDTKVNKKIDQVSLIAKIKNDCSKNVCKICELMNELQDEIYSDDSWFRLVELNKINALIDHSLDYIWKIVYGKNREKHETIDIDKHKDTDGYVSKYTYIINDKLELFENQLTVSQITQTRLRILLIKACYMMPYQKILNS